MYFVFLPGVECRTSCGVSASVGRGHGRTATRCLGLVFDTLEQGDFRGDSGHGEELRHAQHEHVPPSIQRVQRTDSEHRDKHEQDHGHSCQNQHLHQLLR